MDNNNVLTLITHTQMHKIKSTVSCLLKTLIRKLTLLFGDALLHIMKSTGSGWSLCPRAHFSWADKNEAVTIALLCFIYPQCGWRAELLWWCDMMLWEKCSSLRTLVKRQGYTLDRSPAHHKATWLKLINYHLNHHLNVRNSYLNGMISLQSRCWSVHVSLWHV